MAGVFSVCLSEACCPAGEVLQVCMVCGDQDNNDNTSPDAEEASDDTAGVQVSAASAVGRCKASADPAGPCRMDSALRSLGWMLPLRI